MSPSLPRRKAHPDQAGFFRRSLAWAADMAIIAILSLVLYVGFTELSAFFTKRPGMATRLIRALREGSAISFAFGSEKQVKRTIRQAYLEILKPELSPQDYDLAQRMSLEALEVAFKDQIEEGKKRRQIIPSDKAFNLIREIAVGYIYFVLFFRFGGRTPGKRLFRLKVIDLRGREHLGWYQAFERTHGYAASALAASLGYLQVLWNSESLTMHDKLAGTTVIKLLEKRKIRLKIRRRKSPKPDFDYADLLR